MKKIFFYLFLILLPIAIYAEEIPVALDKVSIDRSDKKSIQRGAKFFATNCMSCHTMIYLRYDKLAAEQGVLYDKMPVNIKVWPFGITPPDLSLEADVRGVDWIYTYLHSFYVDPSRPTGFNNLIFPNTVMPAILAPYQGTQIKIPAEQLPKDLYRFDHMPQWYDVLLLQKQGSMTQEQFDATITDVIHFLAYAAEPYHEEQIKIGRWVMVFLLIFFILAYLLKRSYWQDIKRNHE